MRHLKPFVHISHKGTLISPSILLPFNVLVPRHKFVESLFGCDHRNVYVEFSDTLTFIMCNRNVLIYVYL